MRREITVTLNDRGNDLTFKIREMSALQLERWIIRAVLVLAKGGARLPDATDVHEIITFVRKADYKTVLQVLSGIAVEDVQPLLDSMLTGCSRVVGKAEMALTPSILDDTITDVRTLYQLRMEVMKLNFDFFTAGGLSTSPLSPAAGETSGGTN